MPLSNKANFFWFNKWSRMLKFSPCLPDPLMWSNSALVAPVISSCVQPTCLLVKGLLHVPHVLLIPRVLHLQLIARFRSFEFCMHRHASMPVLSLAAESM